MHDNPVKSMIFALLIIPVTVFLVAGCGSTGTPERQQNPEPANVLRIGMSADYPPVAFKQKDKLVGLEVDLAYKLAKALDRPVRFVELNWNEQINALLLDKIDIIMSGMTVTDSRKVRIDFTDSYLELGLMALVRIKDIRRFDSAESLLKSSSNFGVQKGSTAEAFVRKNCPESTSITWLKPEEAPYYLTTRRIDAYIHDGPGIIWLASENETELAALKFQLNNEQISWGVSKADPELKSAVNKILASWKSDGSLQKILDRWLPAGG